MNIFVIRSFLREVLVRTSFWKHLLPLPTEKANEKNNFEFFFAIWEIIQNLNSISLILQFYTSLSNLICQKLTSKMKIIPSYKLSIRKFSNLSQSCSLFKFNSLYHHLFQISIHSCRNVTEPIMRTIVPSLWNMTTVHRKAINA